MLERPKAGVGLSNLELGLRLRYEIERKIVRYVGFLWERSLGKTADFRCAIGECHLATVCGRSSSMAVMRFIANVDCTNLLKKGV